ncbi:hypothetical protein ID866_7659 [Astraeus odoratus]|nr:hypothetical protein ID866_7659 [Astraeus odoratus]
MLARITRISPVLRAPIAARMYSSGRSEGSVAQTREFGKKERAHEEEYTRRHDAELLRKLKAEIEAKKQELAFAALRHKPRDQSTASYILDLQSRFPLSGDNPTQGDQPTSLEHENTRKWREHALALETRLGELQTQQDAIQGELAGLRHDAAQAKELGRASDAPPPKKKAKKNHKGQQAPSQPGEPSWNWDLVRADWSSFFHSLYPPPPSLLVAYTALRGALLSLPLSATSKVKDNEVHLANAIVRALETIHAFLFAGESPPVNTTTAPSPVLTASSSSSVTAASGASLPSALPLSSASSSLSTSRNGAVASLTSVRIAMSTPLLMYALRTAFPTLVKTCKDLASLYDGYGKKQEISSWFSSEQGSGKEKETGYDQLDRVVNALLELTLLPLVRAFRPLCRAHLAQFFDGPRSNVTSDTKTRTTAEQVKLKRKDKASEKQGTRKGKKSKAKTAQITKPDSVFSDPGSVYSGAAPRLPHSPDVARKAPVDIRTDALSLLATIVTEINSALGSVIPLSSVESTSERNLQRVVFGAGIGIRERIALEAIRELEALYGVHCVRGIDNTSVENFSLQQPPLMPESANAGPADMKDPEAARQTAEACRADILRTLTTKDGAWYLCSALHLVVSSPSLPAGSQRACATMPASASDQLPKDAYRTAARASPSSLLLTKAVIEGIGRLLRLAVPDDDIDHGNGANPEGRRVPYAPVDPFTQNILLAICEEAMVGYAELDSDLLEGHP